MVRLNAKTFKIDFEEKLVEGGGSVPWERMGVQMQEGAFCCLGPN